MAKFIEVHVAGIPRLINLDWVEEIIPSQEKSTIYYGFSGEENFQDYIIPDETYEELRLMIGAAQGGIPMDMGGSY